MLFLTWTIIIIILILLIPSDSNHKIFPLSSPFNTDFHIEPETTVTIRNDSNTPLIKTILTNAKIKFQEVKSQPDIWLAPELHLQRNQYDLNFIATISYPLLLLLTSDTNGIMELGDIQHYCQSDGNPCIVKIAVPSVSSAEYFIIRDILAEYPKTVQDNTVIISLQDNPNYTYGTDYQILAKLTEQNTTDTDIKNATELVPSHIIAITRINTGNYFKTHSEKQFFQKNNVYEKALFDIFSATKQYPVLTRVGQQQFSLYIPTIKCKYQLVCKNTVKPQIITKILREILDMYTHRKFYDYGVGMTILDIASNDGDYPYHPAALDIYKELHLVHK